MTFTGYFAWNSATSSSMSRTQVQNVNVVGLAISASICSAVRAFGVVWSVAGVPLPEQAEVRAAVKINAVATARADRPRTRRVVRTSVMIVIPSFRAVIINQHLDVPGTEGDPVTGTSPVAGGEIAGTAGTSQEAGSQDQLLTKRSRRPAAFVAVVTVSVGDAGRRCGSGRWESGVADWRSSQRPSLRASAGSGTVPT